MNETHIVCLPGWLAAWLWFILRTFIYTHLHWSKRGSGAWAMCIQCEDDSPKFPSKFEFMVKCVCVFKCPLYPTSLLLCLHCMCVLFFRSLSEVASSFHTHGKPFIRRALSLFITWISNLFVRTYLDGLVYDIASVYVAILMLSSEKKRKRDPFRYVCWVPAEAQKDSRRQTKNYIYLRRNFLTVAAITANTVDA